MWASARPLPLRVIVRPFVTPMTHQPRLSIGLPVYNGERYLAQAIESLLGQTYSDFELIVCDNASTDGTEAIVRKLAGSDPRVRYHRNDVNIGATPNFNKAFSLAASPYFKWSAHDDLYAPTYLERCIAVLDADPQAVLCHSQTIVIDDHTRRIAPPFDVLPHNGAMRGHIEIGTPPEGVRWQELCDRPRPLDSSCPQERFRSILLRTRWCFEIFGVARREAIAATGGHGNYYGSDKVMLSALSLMGKIVQVPEPLFFRRHHADNSAHMHSASARERWAHPGRSGKLMFPRLRCLQGYCKSVVGAQLRWSERTGCFAAVARYLIQPDRWIAVLREPW
jgi:glycosyltransferase involved in cell wall biosynthesis